MNEETGILTRKAQKGDMDAFSSLFENMRPMAFAIACRLVGPTDADDVVMETYLKAWKAIPRFGGHSSLKTWMYRIVHNCALDFIRSNSRKKEVPLVSNKMEGNVDIDLPDPSQLMPDEVLASSEDATRVRSALTYLSSEHRTALLLRFTDGLSYSEISAATGVSKGTVMSRLFNAKRKLRKVIEDSALDATISNPQTT